MFHVGAPYHHIFFKDVYMVVISSEEKEDHWNVKFKWLKMSNDEQIKYEDAPFKIYKDDLSKWRYGKHGLI